MLGNGPSPLHHLIKGGPLVFGNTFPRSNGYSSHSILLPFVGHPLFDLMPLLSDLPHGDLKGTPGYIWCQSSYPRLGNKQSPEPYAEAFSCKPGRCLPLLTPLPVQCLWWYHTVRCFGLVQWANPSPKTAQYATRQPGLARPCTDTVAVSSRLRILGMTMLSVMTMVP